MVRWRPWQRQSLQVLGLLAFAFAFVVVVGMLNDYSRDHGVPTADTVRMTLFTGVTFVAVAVQFKRYWRHVSFWLFTAMLLAVHVLGYVLFLRNFPDLPLPVFAAVSLLEIPVLCSVLYKVLQFPS
jgi:hypothetical protein